MFYYAVACLPIIERIPGLGIFLASRDRWMFLVSFVLALLAGYGAREMAARAESAGWRRSIGPMLSAILLVDLAGTSLALGGALGTHTSPRELPIPAEWRWSGLPGTEDRGRRVMDLVASRGGGIDANLVPLVVGQPSAMPDHTTGLAVANELYAYYDSLLCDVAAPDSTCLVGERARPMGLADRLGLLNVATVRIDPSVLPLDPAARRAILDGLARESGLVALKVPGAAGYFFRNPRAVECLVPRAAIAIVGKDWTAEAAFERVARLPGFHVGALLPVLLPSPGRLPAEARDHLEGALTLVGRPLPEGWKPISMEALQRLLAAQPRDAGVGSCEVTRRGAYVLELRLAPRERAGFVFLSQAYFEQPGYMNPWEARDEHDRALTTVKAGAGLTAIWAPPDVRTVRLAFRLPPQKRVGAWLSLAAAAGYFGAVVWVVRRRRAGPMRMAPP